MLNSYYWLMRKEQQAILKTDGKFIDRWIVRRLED